MHKATLVRTQSDHKQTLGHFTLYDRYNKIFEAKSLELPNNQNESQISRIPAGYYHVKTIISPSKGLCFSVMDVPNRSYILIHLGNYHYNILGCILLGRTFTDINSDGFVDVTSSRNTMDMLLATTSEFWMRVIDFDEIVG